MKKLYFALAIALFTAAASHAARFYPVPECPYTGHATCSDGKDNDGDGTKDEAAPSAAFSAVTGGYAADVAECQLLGYASTADAESDSGNMAEKSTTYRSGQAGCTGNFTAGTYFVWIKARIASGTASDKRLVWSSLTPFTSSRALANAGLPFISTSGIASVMAWTKLGADVTIEQIGVLGQPNTITHRSFALSGNGTIYLTADAAVKLDCIFISTNSDTAPTCPSGSQEPATAPQAGAITVSGVTTTAFTASWDFDTESTDDGDCFLRYGTTSGSLSSTSATASSTSGTCSRQITGLTSGTIYFMRGTSENENGSTETPQTSTQTSVQVTGPIRYATPSGGSTVANCLDSGTKCTLLRALNQAQAGDTVLLACGTYTDSNPATVRSGTATQPITITSETSRCATIQYPGSTTNSNRIFNVAHSHIHIKDVVFDGNTWSWDGLRVNATTIGAQITGLLIHNVQVTRSGGKAIGLNHYINGGTIRWSDFDNFGTRYGNNDTCWYMGSASNASTGTGSPAADDWVENIEAYGNTCDHPVGQFSGENIVDLKNNTRNWYIHHNTFKDLVSGNDGCIVMGSATAAGSNLRFEDNIIQDSQCGSAIFDYVHPFANQQILRNVFKTITTGALAWYWAPLSAANTVFANNTGCSITGSTGFETRPTGTPTGTPSGITLSSNSFAAATAVCDAEIVRILSEQASLPGNPNAPTPETDEIAHFNFNENTGTAAADSSAGGQVGTLTNGATWDTGKDGSGVSLDGTNDFVKITTLNWSATTGTVTFWYKPSSFPDANTHYIFGHTVVPCCGSRIQFYFDDTGGNLDMGLGDSHTRALAQQDMATGTWYHLGLTWSNGTYVVYVNGAQVSTGSYTGLSSIGGYVHLGGIGDDAVAGTATWALGAAGVVDEFKAWNRALSAAEVDAEFDIFGP
jgi:hypothetical protein